MVEITEEQAKEFLEAAKKNPYLVVTMTQTDDYFIHTWNYTIKSSYLKDTTGKLIRHATIMHRRDRGYSDGERHSFMMWF